MFLSTVLAAAFFANAAPEADELFLKQAAAKEAELATQLKRTDIWTDPAQQGQLLAHLRVASALKSSSLAPVLAEHIDYTTRKGLARLDGLKTIEQEYPVVGALEEIGMTSVPVLLNLLKREANSPKPHDAKYKTLVICCMIEIYDRAGFGADLARRRIELEISKATGKEKAVLQQALSHYLFKE